MLTKQQIFDHTVNYFNKRVNTHNGFFVSGWGDYLNPDSRCAIGSLYPYKCESTKDWNDILMTLVGHGPQHIGDSNNSIIDFCIKIEQFNDALHNSTRDIVNWDTAVTINLDNLKESINSFLRNLALEHNLNFNSIKALSEKEKVKNHKWREIVNEDC